MPAPLYPEQLAEVSKRLDKLTQSLEELGETLANGLNQSAMGKFPAKKIAAAG